MAYGSAVDGAGSVAVTGSTGSVNFPVTSPAQTANGGNSDVFVAKFNPAGSGLIYSTYLGGTGSDTGTSIAIDASGNAYVASTTYSLGFPITSAFQSAYGGAGDGFIAKLRTNRIIADLFVLSGRHEL